MEKLIAWRHVVAPGAGAMALLGVIAMAPGALVGALISGGVVWAGTALLLSPSRPFARLHGRTDLAVDALAMEQELGQAQHRIRDVTAAVAQITDEPVRQALRQIVSVASTLIEGVVQDPGDYPRVRKALVHYLGHVAAISTSLAAIGRGGVSTVDGKTRETLGGLVELFAGYRDRMLENERFDVDTRIALLEKELQQSPLIGRSSKEPAP